MPPRHIPALAFYLYLPLPFPGHTRVTPSATPRHAAERLVTGAAVELEPFLQFWPSGLRRPAFAPLRDAHSAPPAIPSSSSLQQSPPAVRQCAAAQRDEPVREHRRAKQPPWNSAVAVPTPTTPPAERVHRRCRSAAAQFALQRAILQQYSSGSGAAAARQSRPGARAAAGERVLNVQFKWRGRVARGGSP